MFVLSCDEVVLSYAEDRPALDFVCKTCTNTFVVVSVFGVGFGCLL